MMYKIPSTYSKNERLLTERIDEVMFYNRYIYRSHADFGITFQNIISRVMLEFLIVFTFVESEYNEGFDDYVFNFIQNIEEVLGSYSYRHICRSLKITQIVKRFPPFKNIMKRQRFGFKSTLFFSTKKIIYKIFQESVDVLYKKRKFNLGLLINKIII